MRTKNLIWRRAAFAVVLAVSGCTYTTNDATPSPTSPNPLAPLEKQVQLFMDQGAVAAVVQVRWPEDEWSKAYGMRDLDSKTPAQPTDRVQVASVTKTMTAVADNGGLRSAQTSSAAQAGDDKGGLRTTPEPGDDKGGASKATEPGDDSGGHGGHGADD
jgi:hypothetical protein